MELTDGNVFHIYNKGNQQQQIFFSEANYLFFLKKMEKAILPHAHLLAYCLMPNHFHWIVQIKAVGNDTEPSCEHAAGFSKSMAVLLRSYTRAIQRQEQFTGSLFQQNSKSKILITENDILNCFNYVHQNPVKAKLAETVNTWTYSSAAEYLRGSVRNICNKQLLYDLALINDSYAFNGIHDECYGEEKIKRIFA